MSAGVLPQPRLPTRRPHGYLFAPAVPAGREQVEALAADGQLLLLEEVSERQARPEKRRWALFAFTVFLFFSLTHLVPLPIAVLLGVMILLASQSLRTSEIYEIIDWRLLILIACMISFGVAMEKTGADQYLANLIVRGTGHYGPIGVLAGFFLMTVESDAADVKPGCCSRYAANIREDCACVGTQSENVCDDGNVRGFLFFSDAARAGLRPGLHTGSLSLFGLPESGFNLNDRSICDCAVVGSQVLAVPTMNFR